MSKILDMRTLKQTNTKNCFREMHFIWTQCI